MNVYLWLSLVFLIQEPLSATIAVSYAHQHGVPNLHIHLLYAVFTCFDIFVGAYLGKLFFAKYKDTRIGTAIERMVFPVTRFIHAPAGFLFATSLLVGAFPLSMLGMPWLSYTLREAFVMYFLGGIVMWYLPIWLVVYGVSIAGYPPDTSIFLATVVIAILSYILPKTIANFYTKDARSSQ